MRRRRMICDWALIHKPLIVNTICYQYIPVSYQYTPLTYLETCVSHPFRPYVLRHFWSVFKSTFLRQQCKICYCLITSRLFATCCVDSLNKLSEEVIQSVKAGCIGIVCEVKQTYIINNHLPFSTKTIKKYKSHMTSTVRNRRNSHISKQKNKTKNTRLEFHIYKRMQLMSLTTSSPV